MEFVEIKQEKLVKITNNGMITIPAAFRHKYQINDGDQVLIIEDEGTFRIIPILNDDRIQPFLLDSKKIVKQWQNDKKAELEREL